MNAQDYVRLLTLLSASVLAWSSWKQYDWQRTQATRDEEAEAARRELEALQPKSSLDVQPAPTDSQAAMRKEAENAAKLKLVAARNAARPFFDVKAYFYFLAGFLLSVIASLIDIVWGGTIGHMIDVARHIFTR